MYCPKCGAKLNDNALFCRKCGYRLKLKVSPIPKKYTKSKSQILQISISIILIVLIPIIVFYSIKGRLPEKSKTALESQISQTTIKKFETTNVNNVN